MTTPSSSEDINNIEHENIKSETDIQEHHLESLELLVSIDIHPPNSKV
jgi:hypothetical protein